MTSQPIVFVWTELEVCAEGGVIETARAMVPHLRYARVAARQFELGGEYPLEVVQNRSMASHNQYFAAVGEAYDNLPEKISASFPSAEHLRKWALIQCGHFEQKETEWDTRRDAMRHATFVRIEDEFARIKVDKTVVIVRRAKSQSLGAMKKKEFEQSKKDVLDLLESMTSVPKGSLMKHAGRGA